MFELKLVNLLKWINLILYIVYLCVLVIEVLDLWLFDGILKLNIENFKFMFIYFLMGESFKKKLILYFLILSVIFNVLKGILYRFFIILF